MEALFTNPDFLKTCQLEAIGQLKEKGISETEIMSNPALFAKKVYEVAKTLKAVETELS